MLFDDVIVSITAFALHNAASDEEVAFLQGSPRTVAETKTKEQSKDCAAKAHDAGKRIERTSQKLTGM